MDRVQIFMDLTVSATWACCWTIKWKVVCYAQILKYCIWMSDSKLHYSVNTWIIWTFSVFSLRTQFRSGVKSLRMVLCSGSHCAESECSSQVKRPRRLLALPTFSTVHLKSEGWKQPRWTVWLITYLIPAARSRTMAGYFFLHTAPSSPPTNSLSCFSRGVCVCVYILNACVCVSHCVSDTTSVHGIVLHHADLSGVSCFCSYHYLSWYFTFELGLLDWSPWDPSHSFHCVKAETFPGGVMS